MKEAQQKRNEMGLRVRNMRKTRNLTLQQVADRAGMSVSTLSKIERGLLAPSYDKFSNLAQALGVDIFELHSDRSEQFDAGAFLVARAGESTLMTNETYSYELLFAQALGKSMRPAFCTLKPLEDMVFEDHARHDGQEFVYVIEGKVTMHVEGKPPVLLNTGDSVYFDCSRGHIYSATKEQGARILLLHAPAIGSTEMGAFGEITQSEIEEPVA